jgi:ribonuclease HI
LKEVTIYTDGACSGNPGPGGWAAILESGAASRELCGAEPATTNNRMELQSAINALAALKTRCEVTIFTDSEYLRQGITEWVPLWRGRKWLRGRKAVKNEDLWKRLDKLVSGHAVQWHWVRGHSGHVQNERCDQLATSAMRELMNNMSAAELRAALEAFQNERQPQKDQISLF